MILLNFAHPITEEQQRQIENLTQQKIEKIIAVNSQINPEEPLAPQITAMADACGLSQEEWQTLPLLINPPSLNFSTAALIAELHGRMGYFPAMVRLKPAVDERGERLVPPRFVVAEIVNLQAIRDAARARR